MRKNIALLALEGEQIVEDQQRVEPEDLQEMSELDKDIETDQMVIEETEETAEAIGDLAETVEAQSGEEGEGISPETAEAVEVAVEHFCQRVGYSRKKISLATESFASCNRKQKSIALAKDLRIAQEHLNKQLSIAQEGLWDKIKNKFDRIFTTRKKLAIQAKAASSKYDSNGKSEKPITGKYLSIYLNSQGKDEINGKDVLANLDKITKIVDNQEILKIADQLTKLTSDTIDTLVKERTNSDGKNTGLIKLTKLVEETTKLVAKVEELVKSSPGKTVEGTLLPVESAEKEKIIKLVETSLNNKRLIDSFEKLWDKNEILYEQIKGKEIITADGKYVSIFDADESAAKRVFEEIDTLWDLIMDLDTATFNIAHAAVRYVELSTAK